PSPLYSPATSTDSAAIHAESYMYRAHGLGAWPNRSWYLASKMRRTGLSGGVGNAPVMLTDAIKALISSGAWGGYMTGENASLLPYHFARVSVGSRRAWPRMFRPSGWKPTSSTAVSLTPSRRTVCARFC